MNITLVFPPFYLESMYNLPPLGLINLATSLKETPHQVVIHDFVLAIRQGVLQRDDRIYDHCAEIILAGRPDLVGFSAQCTTYPAVIQLAQKVKQVRPAIKIVLGGHNAGFVDVMTLESFPWIDAVVRGEGEITFRELVAHYDMGNRVGRIGPEEGIPGVTFRQNNQIIRGADRELIPDLDCLPLPDYSFAPPLGEYRAACHIPRSIAILEAGRGCPHQCVYCSESILWRRRSRTFSVARLVAEMHNLSGNFGAECFLLAFDQFTAKREFVESFCRQVIDQGLNHLPWYCISRLDSVDSDLLDLMHLAGCESLCYGIDSGSKKTLAFIRKHIDHSILFERVKDTAAHGIIPTLSFVIGFPEEDIQDIDATLELALMAGIVGNNNPLLQLPTVLPGTELYNRYQDRLVRVTDTYFSLGLEFHNDRRQAQDDHLIDAYPLIFSSFYNLPCPGLKLPELNLVAGYFPIMIRYYPKSFLLLCREMNRSIAVAFLDWLNWLTRKLERDAPTLTPEDCYKYFSLYTIKGGLAQHDFTFKFLPEMIRYETLSLEVGQYDLSSSQFNLDIHQVGGFRPVKSPMVILAEFDYPMPQIITDLKLGLVKADYPPEPTHLIFKQEKMQLDVSEINPFGRELLEHCDGKQTPEDVARSLYPEYGGGLSPTQFLSEVVTAIQTLGQMKLLTSE
ncbi:MAG: B12-binding domain-containing radical SAM protein [Deltaproteobacteria bacterium]|nr:B12-binding domain-containing radical SAM protein [Deltaproteobacteria bacterium]